MTRRIYSSLLAVAVVTAFAAEASAQARPPHIMVLFDTSGSMLFDLDGDLTGGDGSYSLTPWGTYCCPGWDEDGVAGPDGYDSRLYIAKEVLNEAIWAVGEGEIVFGLARYWQAEHPGWTYCNPREVQAGTYYGNDDGSCTEAEMAGPTSGITYYEDRISYQGTLCAVGENTGNVLVGYSSSDARRNELLSWLDHHEVSTASGGGSFTNPELRGIGATPLAGAVLAVRDYFAGLAANPCEQFAVVLTDGGQTDLFDCAGDDPVAAVTALAAQGVTVYVVAFTITGPDLTVMDNMAAAGGTDFARRANSREELRAAFGEIIEAAIQVEICNNVDDDCDGFVDEDLFRACSTACGDGQQQCSAGTWGACSAPTPSTEICNGVDDDCDGAVDEGTAGATCGTDVGICTYGTEECRGGVIVCVGGTQPQTEVCDGFDNDCDGLTDESDPIVDAGTTCGTGVGECHFGVYECVDGELVCSGGEASPEDCNGLDDDCDGEIDEDLTRVCGTPECPGTQECIGGAWTTCDARAPAEEICDGIDNDCDGEIDEDDPREGDTCGSDEGACEAGAWVCVDGVLECGGGTMPTEEICDGIDNDCDGDIDEGIPVGEECDEGSGHGDVGQCEYGRWACVDGEVVCVGVVGPSEEVCDCEDNDCDGAVDEALGGEPCGTDEGECEMGVTACVGCEMVCAGEIGPTAEICDCLDNDCDGEVDEQPDEGELCPQEGAACIDCQCALPCGAGEFPCPAGKWCEDGYCVGDLCAGVSCGECADCNRSTGECVDRCAGRTCPEGMVCYCGRCVANDCYHVGCPEGELCIEGSCQSDPCAGVSCGEDEFCRDGDCVAMCTPAIDCGTGQHCVDGECVEDPCWGVTCDPGEVCVPETGECSGACRDITCPPGQVCNPANQGCFDDPCTTVQCPEGSRCEAGSCIQDDVTVPDAGPDADGTYVLATGAGGCACRSASTPASGAPLFAALFALLALRRRR